MSEETARLATRTLTSEVAKKVRERGLVLWVDAERHFTGFVDGLKENAAQFAYPVVAFRGSYLELMLGLERYGNEVDPEHVLVHLPGLNKETVKETPVYELYKAGTVFEKNLGTLVREASVGVARPEEVETFLKQPSATLEAADDWLGSINRAPRDQVTVLLESLGVDDVVLGLLGNDSRIRGTLPDGADAIFAYVEKSLGITREWRAARPGRSGADSSWLADVVASWLMSVEFVHDLKELPVTEELLPLTRLAPVLVKECRRLVTRFRDEHPDAYEVLANDEQSRLDRERTSHHAAALGSIDTFRFEETTTRAAALDALAKEQFSAAHELAAARTPDTCFWVRRSPKLQRTWDLIHLAAKAGNSFAETVQALLGAASLEEALERYVTTLAPVDRAHRIFEQRANAVLFSDLEDYDRLLEVRDAVRRAYRVWANTTNRAFFELCRKFGALPARDARQRAIYEDVVQPFLQRGERVAYFMVDAFRFEMAQALAEELKREKFHVTVGSRLAELPTETKVCMNALAPVESNGRLRPIVKDDAIEGFRAGAAKFSVRAPVDRVRAMAERSFLGASPPEDVLLEEFQSIGLKALTKRIKETCRLVVVRSTELDTAGEVGLHLGTFDQTMTLIKSAVSLLQQAGVDRFVIAADHGFLLQDSTVDNVDFGKDKRTPKRRHAVSIAPTGMADVLEVPLSSLDYDVEQDTFLVFRPDTALWKTSEKVQPFVHGGNSLQERVVPVIVAEGHVRRGRTTSRYEVVATAEPAHLGRQRLKIAVRLQLQSSASLAFHSPKAISLALRVPGRPQLALRLLNADPPADLRDGRVLVPPNRDFVLVEFELEGEADEKVRVEVFHPDAVEDVTPKTVEGFFDVARKRVSGAERSGKSSQTLQAVKVEVAAVATPQQGAATVTSAPAQKEVASPEKEWATLVEDAGFQKALTIIETQRMINEADLQMVLGSPRRVRAFSRHFDKLRSLVPFAIEITVVSGMKAYVRKD